VQRELTGAGVDHRPTANADYSAMAQLNGKGIGTRYHRTCANPQAPWQRPWKHM